MTQRSDRQNRYYRGVVVSALAEYLRREGMTPAGDCDGAHELLKEKFLPRGIASTTQLDTAGFAKFVRRGRGWMRNRLGVPTADPE